MRSNLAASALMATLICAALSAAAQAQSATPSPDSTQPPRIAPGTVIPVELTRSIDAKKAKTGDEVLGRVAQDVKTSSGEILVLKDAKVAGHVTEARARSKEQKESEVGIAFDHAVTKSGDVQLPMSIQAIIAPQNNDPAEAGPNPSYGGSPSPSMAGGGGRSPMSGGTPPPTQPQMPGTMPTPETRQSGGSARPPITASTQGVYGMSNVKLADNAAQGSVVSSEKNNVKLESGTILLLRVNP